MAEPVFPDAVRDRAVRKMNRDIPVWLLGTDTELSIPLHPLTGRQAAEDLDQAKAFNAAWIGNPHVHWETRAWHAAGLGMQEVPTRFIARGAEEISQAAGRAHDWHETVRKFHLLCHDAATPEVLATAARTVRRWVELDDADLTRIRHVVRWFLHNPDSGLLPRAVAVEGIHGKWLENNTSLVQALLSAARGAPDGSAGDLGLGVIEPTVRLRRLDPLLRGSEHLDDISVPLSEATSLFSTGHRPKVILMVENLATFLSFTQAPEGSGAVVLWTKGYAVDVVARMPWFEQCRLLYWGDLDSDGFAILHRLRRALNEGRTVDSVLMDPETVNRFATFGVHDPGDVSLHLPSLNADEESARNLLVIQGVMRIEQERIPWQYALDELKEKGFPGGTDRG